MSTESDVPYVRPLDRWCAPPPSEEPVGLREVRTPVGPMLVHEADVVITPALVETGIWEPAETAFLQATLGAGMTVLDIGAHCGYFTLLAAHAVGPEGLVMAFEPNPRSLDALRRNIWSHGLNNVIVMPFAIGSERGWTDLHLSATNTGDHRIIGTEDDREAIRVPIASLDSLWPLPSTPDFVKIDTQGAEGHVFAGMTLLLGERAPSTWVIEFWPFGLSRAGTDPERFLATLAEAGFAMRELHPQGTGPTQCTAESLLRKNPPNDAEKHTNLILSLGM